MPPRIRPVTVSLHCRRKITDTDRPNHGVLPDRPRFFAQPAGPHDVWHRRWPDGSRATSCRNWPAVTSPQEHRSWTGTAFLFRSFQQRRFWPCRSRGSLRSSSGFDLAQFPFRALRASREQAGEQSPGAPTSEARVDRTPRTTALRQNAPRNAGAQDVEAGREHDFIVLGRSTPARPLRLLARAQLIFLRLATRA